MKITVCFGATKIIVPCGSELPVRELVRQAIVRYRKVTNKLANDYINVHCLQTCEEGAILDEDDTVGDVLDDRDKVVASFEENLVSRPGHNGGDGTSTSSVGTASTDIFQGEIDSRSPVEGVPVASTRYSNNRQPQRILDDYKPKSSLQVKYVESFSPHGSHSTLNCDEGREARENGGRHLDGRSSGSDVEGYEGIEHGNRGDDKEEEDGSEVSAFKREPPRKSLKSGRLDKRINMQESYPEVVASFEENQVSRPRHNDGDRTRSSSVGAASTDIFQGEIDTRSPVEGVPVSSTQYSNNRQPQRILDDYEHKSSWQIKDVESFSPHGSHSTLNCDEGREARENGGRHLDGRSSGSDVEGCEGIEHGNRGDDKEEEDGSEVSAFKREPPRKSLKSGRLDKRINMQESYPEVVASFEENLVSRLRHNGGDGTSTSSVGTASIDLFQGEIDSRSPVERVPVASTRYSNNRQLQRILDDYKPKSSLQVKYVESFSPHGSHSTLNCVEGREARENGGRHLDGRSSGSDVEGFEGIEHGNRGDDKEEEDGSEVSAFKREPPRKSLKSGRLDKRINMQESYPENKEMSSRIEELEKLVQDKEKQIHAVATLHKIQANQIVKLEAKVRQYEQRSLFQKQSVSAGQLGKLSILVKKYEKLWNTCQELTKWNITLQGENQKLTKTIAQLENSKDLEKDHEDGSSMAEEKESPNPSQESGVVNHVSELTGFVNPFNCAVSCVPSVVLFSFFKMKLRFCNRRFIVEIECALCEIPGVLCEVGNCSLFLEYFYNVSLIEGKPVFSARITDDYKIDRALNDATKKMEGESHPALLIMQNEKGQDGTKYAGHCVAIMPDGKFIDVQKERYWTPSHSKNINKIDVWRVEANVAKEWEERCALKSCKDECIICIPGDKCSNGL